MVRLRRSPEKTDEKPAPPPKHSPALERFRIDNLLDIGIVLEKVAPSLASLALREARQISRENSLPINEVIAERYLHE